MRAGVAERMDPVGRRNVRHFLLEQHREFFPQLPFIVVGAVAPDDTVWATLVANHPGFMHAPNDLQLDIGALPYADDPVRAGLSDGASVGMLGIELHTRRRNRLNGYVKQVDAQGFSVRVSESYGNCPQYIQLRDFVFDREPTEGSSDPIKESATLSGIAEAEALVRKADTFFVASYVDDIDGTRKVDVSHRGGKSGFVRIGDDGVLTIPDFAGNLFFNTLGNFVANPKAGLVFPDFETGDLVQMTGVPEVILDSPEIAAFQGAERLWRFTPTRVLYRPHALPMHWAFREHGWSPNALMTGDWNTVDARLQAAIKANEWRPFRVAKIVDESTVIRSFHLEPADGAGLTVHEAGQHLPIRVTLPGETKHTIRTYTLSTAPSDDAYRISVKREGVVSTFLHDTIRVGDQIEARAPAGQFTIDAREHRPAVLLAAGVGVTPMLSMLRHIVYEGLRKRRIRPTWFFQSARLKAERAFSAEIAALAAQAQDKVHVVRLLSDSRDAVAGTDFDVKGRISIAALRATLPFDDYDFYLCGPTAFMQSIYDGLRGLNIADARIHAEAFGPSGLVRKADMGVDVKPSLPASTQPVAVHFAKSDKPAQWTPESGTLLELAEAAGLSPEYSCRGGTCGTCRTRIVEGRVAYTTTPSYSVNDNEALICCAVPAQASEDAKVGLVLDL
jgi:ferredoxin-NADP reductase/predicted pyridoxine 5'-phosphate oxidase superfamily flavin-nucleotide-binding protein